MLTGKRFRLRETTLAIDSSGGKKIAVTIHAGEIIEVIWDPLPTDARMVGVRWNGKRLIIFAKDIEGHGEEIPGPTAGA